VIGLGADGTNGEGGAAPVRLAAAARAGTVTQFLALYLIRLVFFAAMTAIADPSEGRRDATLASLDETFADGRGQRPDPALAGLDRGVTEPRSRLVEELTRTILESGLLNKSDGEYVLSGPIQPLAIPTTLQDSLMARLDQLDDAQFLDGADDTLQLLADFAHGSLLGQAVLPILSRGMVLG